MSRKPKYPHLKELYYTDRNAYYKEWRKLNPKYNKVKDEWRKLDKNLFKELPTDVIPIDNFPTYYARPNGEVWRDTRGKESAVKIGKERVLRLTPTYNAHNGYWLIQPYQDNKKKAIHLHRLILTAFKGPAPDINMECHHIDHNTSNNSADNLMWVTRQQNADYVPRTHRMGNRITLAEGRKISNSKHRHIYLDIIRYRKEGKQNKEIASILNVKTEVVSSIAFILKQRGEI
jgi:hypothetical protein